MVLMSWRCLSHVYRDVLRLAPQAALRALAGHIQSDRLFNNASPQSKAVLHLVSVRSHTTRTPRGLGPPDLDFVLDSLAGPSDRTMAQCGAFKRLVQRIWRLCGASCPPSCMGWARSFVRGQAALDGRIPGLAQCRLVWFSYCAIVSSWMPIRLFNGMFFHLTSEGQPHRRSRRSLSLWCCCCPVRLF